MRILVLATGGTIGSAAVDGVISTKSGTESQLISLYRENYADDTQFKIERIADTLSENITDAFYETLLNTLSNISYKEYDGVLILHGTDTLPYTAALVAEAFKVAIKPIGFVGANFPLQDVKSNGVINFHAAVQYIKAGGQGFFVPYQNHDDKIWIHAAERLLEADFIYDDFQSLGQRVLAELSNDEIIFYEKQQNPNNQNKKFPWKKQAHFLKQVLLIKGYPGLDYSVFDVRNKNIAAVLHTAYHAGTASTAEAPYSLPTFSRACARAGVDVYIAGLRYTRDVYKSADTVFKNEVTPLFDMTVPTALAKLKIAYNQDRVSVKEYLKD